MLDDAFRMDDDAGARGVAQVDSFRRLHESDMERANDEQTNFVKEVMAAAKLLWEERMFSKGYYEVEVKSKPNRLFYITGDGGVGKTFVYNVRIYEFLRYLLRCVNSFIQGHLCWVASGRPKRDSHRFDRSCSPTTSEWNHSPPSFPHSK